MNIVRMLFHTLFYSKSNLSIVFDSKNTDSYSFDIKYKETHCGLLHLNEGRVALIYARGLHLFKGLIDCQNIEMMYNRKRLELYLKSNNRKILEANCTNDVFEAMQSIINKDLRN